MMTMNKYRTLSVCPHIQQSTNNGGREGGDAGNNTIISLYSPALKNNNQPRMVPRRME
jgi:hypothetical protein